MSKGTRLIHLLIRWFRTKWHNWMSVVTWTQRRVCSLPPSTAGTISVSQRYQTQSQLIITTSIFASMAPSLPSQSDRRLDTTLKKRKIEKVYSSILFFYTSRLIIPTDTTCIQNDMCILYTFFPINKYRKWNFFAGLDHRVCVSFCVLSVQKMLTLPWP